MSNKNRNRQPVTMTTTTPPVNQDSAQQEQNQQGQEDQAEDSAQQEGQSDQNQDSQENTGTEQQQSNDQSTGAPAVTEQKKEEAVQAPVPQKPVEAPAPTPKTQQEGFTPVYKVQLDLASYAEAMDNKKSIVPEEGGKWQYSLFTTLKATLNAKDQDTFNKEWNTALQFFHQNKDGIFNENFIFRFPEQWPGSSTEFTSFRRIVYMMIQTANAKTRKTALRDINMELVVEGLNQAQRTKFLNFYEA
jgi:hypothetical protein